MKAGVHLLCHELSSDAGTSCDREGESAHLNPSVSIAMGVVKRISLLRSTLFIVAQSGGGIAGAALHYRISKSDYQGNLPVIIYSGNNGPWERFGIEFVMTFVVVFSYFVSMDTYRKWTGTSSIAIGSTYSACSLVSMSFLNPARSIGPSFVLNKWDNHWVYWLGPLSGGMVSGLVYEYIFNLKRLKRKKDLQSDELSSMHSHDIDNYDNLDKPTPPKCHESTYNTYQPNTTSANVAKKICGSLYSVPPIKLERDESIYGGTRSLYCNSPSLTRANLNRSQSLYAKSNTSIVKDILPKPGPLVPTRSMYALRLHQHTHVENQNLHNQLQQKSETVYGVREVTPGIVTSKSESHNTEWKRENYPIMEMQRGTHYSTTERKKKDNYAVCENPFGLNNAVIENTSSVEENTKSCRNLRPESVYGKVGSSTRKVVSQSDDPKYGSYTCNNYTRNTNILANNSLYPNTPTMPNYPSKLCSSGYSGLSGVPKEYC
ncbi:hypothetical protein NQ315_015101 [Exocentrus adspersus]|uniref:Uncharacterized protein n=1 Tax=Exocentrus adspersus TaxID=1586481 RepID=A0AAV8VWQ5_9CUCU|nr:hypothetical protein NQ315_015101 [Exocentrus adspersus]